MGSTGFRIDQDGTIIREPQNTPKHNSSPDPEEHGKKRYWPILIIVVVLAGIIGYNHVNDNEAEEQVSYLNSEEKERNEVMSTIIRFNNAYMSNDFEALSKIFAKSVARYHDAYNLTNTEVVGKFKNYDKKFGVYGKHVSVRWNTLQIDKIPDNELSVVFVEDYSIDREDNTKNSVFVLEEHIILDKDYRIKSIYDVQLEKRRK